MDPAGTSATPHKGLASLPAIRERHLLLRFGIGLAERQGNAAWLLPVPAAFVLDRQGTVAWAHVDADFTRRAEPAEVIAALRALG